MENATSQIIQQMGVRMHNLLEDIEDHEDFEIIASSHKAGKAFTSQFLGEFTVL